MSSVPCRPADVPPSVVRSKDTRTGTTDAAFEIAIPVSSEPGSPASNCPDVSTKRRDAPAGRAGRLEERGLFPVPGAKARRRRLEGARFDDRYLEPTHVHAVPRDPPAVSTCGREDGGLARQLGRAPRQPLVEVSARVRDRDL